MSVLTRPLETLDDAKRVGELVYSTYGLTYHRGWLYEPERLLALNRRGVLTSMLALVRTPGGPRVVGHLAAIRPYFEMLPDLGAVSPTVVEVGLSIVDPQHRAKNVQNTMSLALLMYGRRRFPRLCGAYMKCVTRHTHSQRSARRFLGRAMAVHLGGVPAWVRSDGMEAGGPLTTIAMHCAIGDQVERTLFLPEGEVTIGRELFRAAQLRRRIVSVPSSRGGLPAGSANVVTRFDPSRRHGTVRVLQPGRDLVQQVLDRTEWLVGGSMQHVTVLLPLASPAVAAAVPRLQEGGLFLAGFLPDLEGIDTLLLQAIDLPELDPSDIEVVGDDARLLLSEVFQRWRANRPDPLTGTSISLTVAAAS